MAFALSLRHKTQLEWKACDMNWKGRDKQNSMQRSTQTYTFQLEKVKAGPIEGEAKIYRPKIHQN